MDVGTDVSSRERGPMAGAGGQPQGREGAAEELREAAHHGAGQHAQRADVPVPADGKSSGHPGTSEKKGGGGKSLYVSE